MTVIRAFDLVVQREQTATILLQDAQQVLRCAVPYSVM
jgi:hypothetical protein